ncbi:COX15/CtaA family protein [Actinoplanes aureus]|uniref:COX15/CtaA family protein n=1 Tax=Actinoplanes aureus TaxID=2792083 RepID=A0A931C9Z1_9ACTN|nr:COX15/CtaA family protein [Actinoplanes aureus]MBG0563586.1 COX15/CtaA family protein [Actinoplanes aureus]
MGSALRPLALASLVANVSLIVTGAAVRLTNSGLGCPTWPKCTQDSYTTTPEMGVHGVIEFGNRMLTWVLVGLAVACFLGALNRRRRSLIRLSVLVALGVPGQGVVGGITVLTNLNPWVVGLHFILSIGLIAACFALWRRVDEGDGEPVLLVPVPLRQLTWITVAASFAVIAAGVVVTGSGPHAGDQGAKRNGLDPATVSQVHADLVFLLVGLSVALWFALRAAGAPATAVRAAAVLIAVELSQGLIGFVQYFTHLPVILVAAHMLGSGLVWTSTLAVLWSLRKRPEVPAKPGRAPSGTSRPLNEPINA